MADQDRDIRRRATVFGSVAEDYGRLRPAPCDASVDWLLPDGCGRVLDLAAGAGTLTAMLAERVPEVVAVEPDDRMRAVLSARCPGAIALNGTAEDLPLPDGGVDAVVVSSAWHWFDPAKAVPEIARVLRPGGRLGVVWNGMDDTVPWVTRWRAGLRPGQAAVRDNQTRWHGRRGERLRAELAVPDAPFTDIEGGSFRCTVRTTPGDAAALLGTYSRIIALPDADRNRLLVRAEESLREQLGLTGDDARLDLPFRSLCWRATRSTGRAA
jgi:SAM-dependent methyltransferase